MAIRTFEPFHLAIGSIPFQIFSEISIASSIIIVSQEYHVAGARQREVKNLHSEIILDFHLALLCQFGDDEFVDVSMKRIVLSLQTIQSLNRGIFAISFWIYHETKSKALTE